MQCDARRSLVALLMLGHAIVGCCIHHAAVADDNCPVACGCSSERPAALATACQCSHHPHDQQPDRCAGSHCTFTKSENNPTGEAAVAVAHFQFAFLAQPDTHPFDDLAAPQSVSIPRHLLFEVLLV